DAFRLMASQDRCLKCHQIGEEQPSSKVRGPLLDLAASRLRPDWALRWLANPPRLLVYPGPNSPMPTYFAHDQPPWPVFVGTPGAEPGQVMREEAAAVRDALMNYSRIAQMPENRYYKPPAAAPAQPEKK